MRSIFVAMALVSVSLAAVLDYGAEKFKQARIQRRARKEARAAKSKRSPAPGTCVVGPATVGTSQFVLTTNTECPTIAAGGDIGSVIVNGNTQQYLRCTYSTADSSGNPNCVYNPDGSVSNAFQLASYCSGTRSGTTASSERITNTVCPDVAGTSLVVANSAITRYNQNGVIMYQLYCSYADSSVCAYVGSDQDPTAPPELQPGGNVGCACSAPVDSDASQDLSYVLES